LGLLVHNDYTCWLLNKINHSCGFRNELVVQALNATGIPYSLIVEFWVFDGKQALNQSDLVISPAEKTIPYGQ
jgi:hypothetical protein